MRKNKNGTVPRESITSAHCLDHHRGKQLTAGLDEVSHTNQRIVRASHDCCRNTEYRWYYKTREPPIEVEYCPTLNLGLGDCKPDMTVVESATDITWDYRRGYPTICGNPEKQYIQRNKRFAIIIMKSRVAVVVRLGYIRDQWNPQGQSISGVHWLEIDAAKEIAD